MAVDVTARISPPGTRLDLPDEPTAFRAAVRAWFAEHRPPHRDHAGTVERGVDDERAQLERQWQRTLAEAGLAGLSWPEEVGGRAATPSQQLIFQEELLRAGGELPRLFFVGLAHAGPTLIVHGSDEQRARYLPGLLRGDLAFCQLFSEPGAGSDLAAIATFAEVDGDDLVINGEKRWSTLAQHADHAEMLVRTDRTHKQGGLTFAMLDMRTPGITVRPVASLSGAPEFCEVFLDDVRVPLANVVGGLGNGWKVASTTLAHERSTAFAPHVLMMELTVRRLAADVAADPVTSSELARLAIRARGLRALLERSVAEQEHSEPGPAASAMKLLASELNLDISRFAATRLGTDVLAYFEAFGLRIGGGTSEVQRTILGERVLGLPREPKP